jgi:uncharacterized protein YbbK (DUF523 family)
MVLSPENGKIILRNGVFFMLIVGISGCLLGEPVRYDGGKKQNPLLLALPEERVRFIPLCPEAGCGLGVPREPMQLEGEPQHPRLITLTSREDRTLQLTQWCERQMNFLKEQNISGFLLKSRSPSCGLNGAKIFSAPGCWVAGMGLFCRSLRDHFPNLPLAEGDDLTTGEAVTAFLQKVEEYRMTNPLLVEGVDHG